MSRNTVSVLALAAILVLVLWLAADVLLAIFAGILLAVFLRGGGSWLARKLNVRSGIGLALFCLGLTVAIAAFMASAGAALADQAQQLIDRLPSALETARAYVDRHDWIRRAIDMVNPEDLSPSGSGATAALSTTLGAFGNAVVIAFVGLYGAVAPHTYVRGFVAIVAPDLRPTARDMLHEAGVALRGWLRAQFISMAVVGLLTWIGLWTLGVPLAPILAVLAATLTFIPNIGPVLAAVPAVLLGLSEGPSTALYIAALYIAVQTVESYLITPQVQQESVSLPPALTISAQLLFGALFGTMGLALATPMAAVALRLVQRFYVRGYLEEGEPSR